MLQSLSFSLKIGSYAPTYCEKDMITVIVSPFHNGPEVIDISVRYEGQNPSGLFGAEIAAV